MSSGCHGNFQNRHSVTHGDPLTLREILESQLKVQGETDLVFGWREYEGEAERIEKVRDQLLALDKEGGV